MDDCNECRVSRRGFIKSGAIALLGFALAPRFLERAVAATGNGTRNKVLVCCFQRGAADGLSMVIPFKDPNYYTMRSSIAVPAPGRGDEAAMELDGFFGLNPGLSGMKPIWDAGHLAIVHATGSPDTTRSHFDAQDYMESGNPGRSLPDGWINRAMTAQKMPDQTAFRAVALSPVMPRSLRGTFPAVAMTDVASFAIHDRGGNVASKGFEGMYDQAVNDVLHGTGKETFNAIKMLQDKIGKGPYEPANGANYPKNPFGRSMGEIARLIKGDVGLEVAFTDMGGWDTHANQGNGRGRLANNLKGFGDALGAFYQDLGDRMGDVVVLTMTEFGRMVKENGSGGTDHGHASCNFVFGGPVKGHKVYGQWPGLAQEQLYEGRDLNVTTDFRNVFAEVATGHLGIADLRSVFPNFNPSGRLGLV